MTKIFSPKNLRLIVIVTIVFQSLVSLSQSNVYINVNWVNWSSENRVQIINSSNQVVLFIENNYGARENTSFLDQNSTTVSLPNGNYTVRVFDDYGDDWNGTGSYARVFVDGSQAYEFDGNFSNNSTTAYQEITADFPLTIGTIDDASFSYSQTGYCQTVADPTPTITGETGGTFTATPGLSINATTGAIDLSASTIGTYVVTYTTTAPDQNSSTQNVSITDGDIATFSYANPFATQGENDLTPTTTGQSGVFSSSSGLSLNTLTGVIDVSASTAGFYTVSYTTNGSCPKVYTDNVQIIAATFFNASKKYIEYIPGTMPVIISAPHGGVLNSGRTFGGVSYPDNDSSLPDRNCGINEQDDNTDILIREIQKQCFEEFGVYPYIIINNLHRSKLDPNRVKSVATCNNANSGLYFDAYHGFIDDASEDVTQKFGKGLYIDLHGQSHQIPRIEAGYNLPSSSFDKDLDNTTTNAAELARVTIKNLIENNIQNLTFEDLIRGPQSFGGIMQTTGGLEYAALGHAGCSRGVGYRTVPSHIKSGSDQGSCDDTNPGNNAYFAGDYYSNIRHGSGNTGRSNSVSGGGTLNGGGGVIDGIMTEVNRRVRDIGNNVYNGNYQGRSDSRSGTIPFFSRDYAKVIEDFIDKHYNDFSNFSYTTAIHSIYGLDPTPSVTGIAGGTFSSTSGLSINATTGTIDVSASTPGSYEVSYTAPNIDPYYRKDFSITINTNPVTNTFTATSGNWSTASNWSLLRIPLVNDNISIPLGNTATIDTENISVANITIAGALSINAGKSLTVTGDLTNTGLTTVNSNTTSSGSLIVEGTATGIINYNRYIKDNVNWYLVSSPLENQDIDTFVNNNPLVEGSGNNMGLSSYNPVTSSWEYYQDGTTNSGNFILGDGRAIRRTTAGEIVYEGNLETDDVSTPVLLGNDGWNLIGNPFTSFLNANSNANSSNNLLTANFSKLAAGFKAIYFWDTASTSYVPFNNASRAKYVAPGQGFFVKVGENNSVSFNENMQTHQSGDFFLKSEDNFRMKLKVTDGSLQKETEIVYIKKMSKGLDDGFDARLFDETAPFSINTYLVDESDAYKYAIQVLPNNDYSSMVIPVGVNAKSNVTLTFNIDAINIPVGYNIILEDRSLNVFTELNEATAKYTTTASEDSMGERRFYVYVTSKALSTENVESSSTIATIFKKSVNTIQIEGLHQTNATFSLVSVLGKELYTQKLTDSINQEVKIPTLSIGVYIARINFESGKITKKLIFD